MKLEFQPLNPEHQDVLWEFLRLASHEAEVEAVKSNPLLARYAAGLGREGDCGVMATASGEVVGVCWVRLFRESEKGYGWIDEHTPELGIAVVPAAQGQGVGKRLLQEFLKRYDSAFPALSLSVRDDNVPALRIYEACGFRRVVGSGIANRVGGESFTMLWSHAVEEKQSP